MDIFVVVSSVSDSCTYCSYGVHGIYTDLDLAIKRCEKILKEHEFENCESVSNSDYEWSNKDGSYTLEIREEELNKPLEIW